MTATSSNPARECQPENAKAELELLKALASSKGYVACDGKDRPLAHALEARGLAEWKGANWGSQFWAITDAGRAALPPPPEAI